jgi:hypothetical protein
MVESLIKTEDLIRLKEAHTALPLTLSELKDFFGHGEVSFKQRI